jgi:hypothetical protein
MKTRIVLKSFQALSLAALAARDQAGGQAGKGGTTALPAFARHSQTTQSEAIHVPARLKYFTTPGQRTGWQETVNSALNDIDI